MEKRKRTNGAENQGENSLHAKKNETNVIA